MARQSNLLRNERMAIVDHRVGAMAAMALNLVKSRASSWWSTISTSENCAVAGQGAELAGNAQDVAAAWMHHRHRRDHRAGQDP
jgi:hypothetical protein